MVPEFDLVNHVHSSVANTKLGLERDASKNNRLVLSSIATQDIAVGDTMGIDYLNATLGSLENFLITFGFVPRDGGPEDNLNRYSILASIRIESQSSVDDNAKRIAAATEGVEGACKRLFMADQVASERVWLHVRPPAPAVNTLKQLLQFEENGAFRRECLEGEGHSWQTCEAMACAGIVGQLQAGQAAREQKRGTGAGSPLESSVLYLQAQYDDILGQWASLLGCSGAGAGAGAARGWARARTRGG